MKPSELKWGMIMQLNPEEMDPPWGECLFIVTEMTPTGANGYVMLPELGPRAFSVQWHQMTPTGGQAVWRRGKDLKRR